MADVLKETPLDDPEVRRVIEEKDKIVDKVLSTSAKQLFEASPPVRTLHLFGLDIKAEVNINTIVMACSLLTAILSGVWFVYSTAIERPIKNSQDIQTIRQELGTPGKQGYLPGVVRGLGLRMDHVEKSIQQNHDDTVQTLNEIKATIQAGSTDNARRFDRLDNRIDRLIESEGTHHPK